MMIVSDIDDDFCDDSIEICYQPYCLLVIITMMLIVVISLKEEKKRTKKLYCKKLENSC